MRVIGENSGVYVLAVAVLGLVGANAYLARTLADLEREAAAVRQSVVAEVNGLRQATLASGDDAEQRLETLRAELALAKLQTATAAGDAKREAQKRAEDLARQLVQTARNDREWLDGELTNILAVALAAQAALGDLNGELNQKKEEVAAARWGIDQTTTATGGAAAGLAGFSEYLAEHRRELAAMRHRQLSYFQFALAKSAGPQTIGGVPMRLRRADPQQNTYTLEVISTGRTLEQKDRSLNEPVRFYLSDARQPYELVINEIGKDQVRGYLAAPKSSQIATN